MYLEIKKDASNYQQAKKSVVDNFKTCGHGNWIGKPIEQDMFGV